MNMTKSLLAAVALAAAASAQGQVFNTISGPFSGTSLPNGLLGTTFQVTSTLDVDSLAFVDAGADGLLGSVTVGIYKASPFNAIPNGSAFFNATPEVSTTITGSGTALAGNYVWQSIATTTLAPGYYGLLITSPALQAGDNFGDAHLGDSIPTYATTGGVFGGIGDIAGGTFAAPTFATANRFKLVNFGFTPVPEPETYAMIAGVGLVAFGLWRRRQ